MEFTLGAGGVHMIQAYEPGWKEEVGRPQAGAWGPFFVLHPDTPKVRGGAVFRNLMKASLPWRSLP